MAKTTSRKLIVTISSYGDIEVTMTPKQHDNLSLLTRKRRKKKKRFIYIDERHTARKLIVTSDILF